MIKVFIVGTGNIGSHLCRAIETSQNDQIKLAGYTNSSGYIMPDIRAAWYDKTPEKCNLILLALPDDALSNFSNNLTTGATVVHVSGSAPLSILNAHKNHGVLYIPQTFSKNRQVDLSEVTLCLEASNDFTMKQLELVGSTLSRKQKHINSYQRSKLHVAAVYMNNFANHCFYKAQELLQDAQLDNHLLDALMQETTAKAAELGAKKAQTGPARRGDQKTLDRHLSLIEPSDHDMYNAISRSIKKTYES